MKTLSNVFAQKMLKSLGAVMPLAGASCYCVDREGRPFGHHLDGLPVQQLREYRSVYCEFDPLHPRLHEPTDRDIVALREACSAKEPRGYVEGFLHRHGLCDEIEMFFRGKEGRIVLGLGLFRKERDGRFRASELVELRKIKPFLELALGDWLATHGDDLPGGQCGFSQSLTQRENEVVGHLLRGATNREIAEACHVTIATVKAHLFNIFSKTGVTSRTELVTRILAN
jgi:DNA-binding CsgD family transcriptional regulator